LEEFSRAAAITISSKERVQTRKWWRLALAGRCRRRAMWDGVLHWRPEQSKMWGRARIGRSIRGSFRTTRACHPCRAWFDSLYTPLLAAYGNVLQGISVPVQTLNRHSRDIGSCSSSVPHHRRVLYIRMSSSFPPFSCQVQREESFLSCPKNGLGNNTRVGLWISLSFVCPWSVGILGPTKSLARYQQTTLTPLLTHTRESLSVS
jgi:hypothetical protein